MSDEYEGPDRVKQTTVTIGGVRTRVLEVDGAGPPLLLLHGFTDSADGWRPVLGRLGRSGRRAVALDLPGSGLADPMGRPPLRTLDALVDAAIDDHAGPTVLVGNSLGGLLALRAAARGDQRVEGVVALAPAGLAYAPVLELLNGFLDPIDLAVRLTLRLPIPSVMVRGYARLLFEIGMSRGSADRGLGSRYAAHFHGIGDLRRLWSDILALDAEGRNVLDINGIRVPVLLIWGERDPITPVSAARRVLDAVPGSSLVVLPGCGHCPQVQRPARIADLLSDFPTRLRDLPVPA